MVQRGSYITALSIHFYISDRLDGLQISRDTRWGFDLIELRCRLNYSLGLGSSSPLPGGGGALLGSGAFVRGAFGRLGSSFCCWCCHLG